MKVTLLLAMFAVSAVAQTAITINNEYGGGGCSSPPPAGPAIGPSNQAEEGECADSLNFYHEDIMPYSDWDKASGQNIGVAIQLYQAICDALKVECSFTRDVWENIWQVNEKCHKNEGGEETCSDVNQPGQGMVEQWYDGALAWKTNVRKASLAFSDPVFATLSHVLIGKKGSAQTTDGIHADGEGEKIAVQCGWGDIGMLEEEFQMAEILKSGTECATNNDLQLAQVKNGAATLAAFTKDDATHVLAEVASDEVGGDGTKLNSEFFEIVSDVDGKATWEIAPPLSIMTSKRNRCQLKMINKGLAAIKASGAYARICGTANGIKAKCCGHNGNNCPK